ncbi:hypothetical protein F5Y10DRAFT_240197 [Nemania abortiva]|nr:hypothetical protein F5Y10DRAFT_240197 [Nemania abortiva]
MGQSNGEAAYANIASYPSHEDIQRQPWRYIGYKRYAEFIASDRCHFIFRRFGALNARVALRLQDRITELEEKLKQLDEHYSSKYGEPFNNGSFRDDMDDRAAILDELEIYLDRYNQFLAQQSILGHLENAPLREVKNLRRWHKNHQNKAIDAKEHEYLSQNEDLIQVHSHDRTPVRRLIDSSLRLRTMSIWKDNKVSIPEYESKEISYYSDRRMDAFASGVIVFIGAVILLIPLWILQALESLKIKLAVITAFVFIFLVVISLAMVSRPLEALGASAVYAAVLMVFIQVNAAF